jgi:hypothetical protein
MALVKRAHGRNERNRSLFAPPSVNGAAQIVDGADDWDHDLSTLFKRALTLLTHNP